MSQTPPHSLSLPPIPSLDPEPTNTYALLLPHLSLFGPDILHLLRRFYEKFGPIRHWAPVKAFGRVIIVWDEVDDASQAKKQGDWLELDSGARAEAPAGGKQEGAEGMMPGSTSVPGRRSPESKRERDEGEKSYFSPQRKKRRPSSKGYVFTESHSSLTPRLVLRLLALPNTSLDTDPSSNYLRPPDLEKNFLISPPGSPPEGWEPVVEDAPNAATLAEDLQRALERLQLNGHRRAGSREVILDEGGVRVEVEDTSQPFDGGDEVEEIVQDEGSWRVPEQKGRIAPTARPPM